MWSGPLFVSSRRDLDIVVLKQEVEFVPQYLYNERMVLIEALENWLVAFTEEPCANRFCFCQ